MQLAHLFGVFDFFTRLGDLCTSKLIELLERCTISQARLCAVSGRSLSGVKRAPAPQHDFDAGCRGSSIKAALLHFKPRVAVLILGKAWSPDHCNGFQVPLAIGLGDDWKTQDPASTWFECKLSRTKIGRRPPETTPATIENFHLFLRVLESSLWTRPSG